MAMVSSTMRAIRLAILVVLIFSVTSVRSGGQEAARSPSPPPAVPPARFSRSFVEALRGIEFIELSDAGELEKRLTANAEDSAARLRLMAWHQRGDHAGRADHLAKRLAHTFWLIEHHPDSEILHFGVSWFTPDQLSAAEGQRIRMLWQSAVTQHPGNAGILWNASTFFEQLDPELHMRYLEATAAADPNHPFALRPLAHLYALTILNGGPLAARAQAGLERSNNVWVLGNAAYMLQSQYTARLQAGQRDDRAAQLAERYFQRAKALDPKLDRSAILPQVDLQAVARVREESLQQQREFAARAAANVGRIRRLPVSAFPQLPGTIAELLRARSCTVPQPDYQGKPRNVIRGEFFTKGEFGWAVLCSVRNSTRLFAFRNDRDEQPAVLNTSDDLGHLQFAHGRPVYSREIVAVNRDYIIRHYRAYGGPEPPIIDHAGIDDGIPEKGSVVLYHHKGNWLHLPGAD